MTIASLTTKTLLRRVDSRISALRRLIAHDHRDAEFFAMHATTAPRAQSQREALRMVANLLHVERATRRGRLHGTRFPTLDAQRDWLAAHELRICPPCAHAAGLPDNATLAKLRLGELLDLPVGAP